MPSNYLILSHPLLLPPSIFPSIIVFSNESVLRIRWPKCWSFSFSISPSNEYSGLISFKMDWLDFLAVQGTLKNLLQHHSSKASSVYWGRNDTDGSPRLVAELELGEGREWVKEKTVWLIIANNSVKAAESKCLSAEVTLDLTLDLRTNLACLLFDILYSQAFFLQLSWKEPE